MKKHIRRKLIELARKGQTLSYTELNDQLKLGLRFRGNVDTMSLWLTIISRHEMKNHRPVLSALIVNKSIDMPGIGFGKLFPKSASIKFDKAFIDKLQQECFDFWQNNDNYERYFEDDMEGIARILK